MRRRRTRSTTHSPSPARQEEITPMDTVEEESDEPVVNKSIKNTAEEEPKKTDAEPQHKAENQQRKPIQNDQEKEDEEMPDDEEDDEDDEDQENQSDVQTDNTERNDSKHKEKPDGDESMDKSSEKNADEEELNKSSEKKKSEEEHQQDDEKDEKKDRKRKRSRSRSRSATPPSKRFNRRPSPAQNIDDFTNDEDEPDIDSSLVLLSWIDSDLHLKVNSSEFYSARPISEGNLAYAWAGVRATHGVKSGKVAYEVQVNDQNRINIFGYERNAHNLRCGWSVKNTELTLGESALSFAYDGSGKKATKNEFSDYGCRYGGRGDVIGVYLDLDSTPCKIEYTVNGEAQGVAFEFDKSELGDEALYPHISSKNLAFKVNFGQMEKLLVSEVKPRSKHDDRRDSRRESRRSRDRSHDRSHDRSRRDSHNRSRDDSKKDRHDHSKSEKDEKEKSEVKAVKSDEEKTEGEHDEKKEEEQEKPDEKITEEQEEVAVEKPVAEESTNANEEKMETDQENGKEVEEKKPSEEKKESKDSNGESGTETKDTSKSEQPVVLKTLLPDYILIGKIPIEELFIGLCRLETRQECEAILLIGLPCSGKTHWVKNHIEQNPDKHYTVLGADWLLDKMRVN